MAKAVILDVLDTTIGRYVLNLDTNSLNVAVWSGKIELQNLRLNVEAVNRTLSRKAAESPNLAIPFRVVDGSFSSLILEVPWARITSRPVVFRAQGLSVQLEPFDHLAANSEGGPTYVNHETRAKDDGKPKKQKNPRLKSLKYAEEERQRFNAMKKLAVLDVDSSQLAADDKNQTSAGFGARLARRIIENLQFEIENVHFSVKGLGFAVGITLDHLSLVTTDDMGNRTFVDRGSDSSMKSFLYKALAIHGLGIYCDTTTHVTSSVSPESMRYILSPLSFDAKLRQSDCPKCIDFPKYLLSAQLQIVSFVVNRKQLEIVHDIGNLLAAQLSVRRPLFPQYRPEMAITNDSARLWWKYAVRCIGRLNRRRSWVEFYLAFQKRKIYIQLYKRSMYSSTCSWLSPLSADEKTQLDALDTDRTVSVQGIMNWRNLADAQVELEQKKLKEAKSNAKAISKKTSYVSSIFGKKGNKDKGKASYDEDSSVEEGTGLTPDVSPIRLSVNEIKELESIALSDTNALESPLSNDSKLCDIKFKMGTFRVEVITFDELPLATLEMGTTAISFNANADGSFASEFTMTSLNIYDKVTTNSLFPLVVRSLQKSSRLSSLTMLANALEFRFNKESSGDQGLVLKMVAYEIVPSSFLIKEVKRFLSFDTTGKDEFNPLLRKSISGEEDFFFDAFSSSSSIVSGALNDNPILSGRDGKSTKVSEKLSEAFKDAWENKVVRKNKWTVELVINAPIFILPKNSTDPLATVLVFDLGNFHFLYGKGEASTAVQQWCEAQSLLNPDGEGADYCRLEMQNLSFMIGSAGNRDWDASKVRGETESRKKSSEAIIEPISFTMSIGIESNTSSGSETRKCLFGLLPSISFRFSYSQIARILSVLSSWSAVIDSVSSKRIDVPVPIEKSDATSGDAMTLRLVEGSEEVNKTDPSENIRDSIHLNLRLNKLSIIICSTDDESVEAHLVSAEATHVQRSDSSSITNLKMGFFWIIDKLKYPNAPRRQRFLVRSSFPKAASYLETQTNGESYVMQELENLGVFKEHFSGRNSLADITLSRLKKLPMSTDLRLPIAYGDKAGVTVVVAKFRSLFINWNPIAVRSLLIFKTKIMMLSEKLASSGKNHSQTVVSDVIYFDEKSSLKNRSTSVFSNNVGTNTRKDRRASLDISRSVTRDTLKIRKPTIDFFGHDANYIVSRDRTLFILNAEMKGFEVVLNSARDDLPLYVLRMSETELGFQSLSGNSDSTLVNVVVGDLRLEIPPVGKTQPEYRTILGLSPGHLSSLLSADYCKGPAIIPRESIKERANDVASVISVSLSPMRFVYIQAQIMTLVEYVTQGILGAIAAEGTSTQAAVTMKESTYAGDTIFRVNASGFDLVVPEAADSSSYLALQCASFEVEYRSLPRPGEGIACVQIDNVTMTCYQGEPLLGHPIRMTINVQLGPVNADTEEEKAMRLDISLSRAAFVMTRPQYQQIIRTMDNNISEDNPFLREKESVTKSCDDKGAEVKNLELYFLTHGGVKAIEVKRRMYLKFNFQTVLLDVCGLNSVNPLVTIAALDTTVSIQFIHDKGVARYYATMHDLTCEDRRFASLNRPFRYIVRQVTENGKRDVFRLQYEKSKIDGSVIMDLVIGSPQIAIVPDAIAEVKSFFDSSVSTKKTPNALKLQTVETDATAVIVKCDGTSVEASIEGMVPAEALSRTTSLSLKTDDIRLVLIDMGSKTEEASSSSLQPLTETIVFQGKSEASVILTYDTMSQVVATNLQLHGERIEIYTAEGKELGSQVQLIEPSKFSVFLTSKRANNRDDFDISVVTLSNLDLTISMQNIALFQAILTSMSDSFSSSTQNESSKVTSTNLSNIEALQVEKLARALERGEIQETESFLSAGFENSTRDDVLASNHNCPDDISKIVDRKASVKLTLPETSLTVINDLQGLDEALFKLVVRDCVFMGEVASIRMSSPTERSQNLAASASTLIFFIQTNTSLLADYYDPRRNCWEHLLLTPWEINLKATRGKSYRVASARMSTAVDIESHPCLVAFSEQFLISLGAASSMWSVYSGATKKAVAAGLSTLLSEEHQEADMQFKKKLTVVKSMASNAARSLITTMPYGVANRCGMLLDFEVGEASDFKEKKRYQVAPGATEYFRFEPRKKDGVGGWRAYGQDAVHCKTLSLFIATAIIHIPHVDEEVGKARRLHDIGEGRYICSQVVKAGKTTIIHFSSYVDIHNETCVDFTLGIKEQEEVKHVGTFYSSSKVRKRRSIVSQSSRYSLSPTGASSIIGLPVDMLANAEARGNRVQLVFFSPSTFHKRLAGVINMPSKENFLRFAKDGKALRSFELSLSSDSDSSLDSSPVGIDIMVVNVICKVTLIDDLHPFVELYLRPRARLQNNMYINILMKTPMPYTYSSQQTETEGGMTVHTLQPFDSVEVFTRGPSVAALFKCASASIGGSNSEWSQPDWIEIPLGLNKRIENPLKYFFPLVGSSMVQAKNAVIGNEFVITEETSLLPLEQANSSSNVPSFMIDHQSDPGIRTLLLQAENLGVDHTRQVLFEYYFPSQVNREGQMKKDLMVHLAFSTFPSSHHKGHITLLPDSKTPIRILVRTRSGIPRQSLPFLIDDIALCNGGLESSPIFWDDETPSGYFAYRKLALYSQIELHIIPAFVFFNGGLDPVIVQMSRGEECYLEPGQLAPLLHSNRNLGLIVQLHYPKKNVTTSPLRVDPLGLKVSLIRNISSGAALGSVALQTIIGTKDSCFVVKLGLIKYGGSSKSRSESLFSDDFLRLRIRWSRMEVTLNDTAHFDESKSDPTSTKSEENNTKQLQLYARVSRVVFDRFTVDFQRIFKAEEARFDDKVPPERSQFTVIIKNVSITDCSTDNIVLQSSSDIGNFFDLCIRTRGSEDSGMILVDLFDLKLSHAGNKSIPIVMNTNEAFLWNLLDIASRTKLAIGELSGVDLELSWDDDRGEYSVAIVHIPTEERDRVDELGLYRSTANDTVFSVRAASVSPLVFRLSFKRQPQKARYKIDHHVAVGAKFVHYFTTRLKFTIENADIHFPGYLQRNVKGPPDRIIEAIKVFYISQLKFKLFSLISATSLDDWKELAGREDGSDSYVEGDILRLTGNLAGKSAGFLLSRVGSGIGSGFKAGSEVIGNGIQVMTEAIGVGAVGAGVNSVVSGLGEGVGKSVESIGLGTAKVVKGAGKGIGHVVGGVGGGIEHLARGIGKGVVTGNPRHVVDGLGGGVASVGAGLVEGAESIVTGAAEGVISAGKGLFQGVQSVGKGIGGIFNVDSKKDKSKPKSGHFG